MVLSHLMSAFINMNVVGAKCFLIVVCVVPYYVKEIYIPASEADNRGKSNTFAFGFGKPSVKSDFGEVLEWLKRHAWKACSRQNWLAGSNPVLSAG